MSCRHSLANGTCTVCYPTNPCNRVPADRITPDCTCVDSAEGSRVCRTCAPPPDVASDMLLDAFARTVVPVFNANTGTTEYHYGRDAATAVLARMMPTWADKEYPNGDLRVAFDEALRQLGKHVHKSVLEKLVDMAEGRVKAPDGSAEKKP